jgi:hypothetical protein
MSDLSQGWHRQRETNDAPASEPPQRSSIPNRPPTSRLRNTGVENVQSGVHTLKVAAVTPPPHEATAPTISCRRRDWERRGSAWECTSSRADEMDPTRRMASGRNRSVSNVLVERAWSESGLGWGRAMRRSMNVRMDDSGSRRLARCGHRGSWSKGVSSTAGVAELREVRALTRYRPKPYITN